MKIFKFGGASVKDAEGVKNLVRVLRTEGTADTFIVVSAMGKMTNAFENIVNAYTSNNPKLKDFLSFVKEFHIELIKKLFDHDREIVLLEIENRWNELNQFLKMNNSDNYNFIYDQIVGYGELFSTKIISHYLRKQEIATTWIDVRDYIKTNSNYRDATVDWIETTKNISTLNLETLYITQGFLGADKEGKTTTLGREGSDFTAAIIAYCVNAKSVTIWKDVEGVLNADPRHFDNPVLLEQISYDEAIEMAFYGASVIHPKTIKPLENKNIPLFVRSFYDLKSKGTGVTKGHVLIPETPCFILKEQQILVSVAALDFSFIVENHISDLFKILHRYKLKVNLIQNSAIRFSVCVEDKFNQFSFFLEDLKSDYQVDAVENVRLFTIRHATDEAISKIEKKGRVILKQRAQGTVQFVIKE